ncbi:MAG: ectonucleotide pyrophosphatase/phosphodiesterase [Acidobacteriota bacterium]
MTAVLAILLSLVGPGVPAGHLPPPARAVHRLLVISIDGLDWRYLKDADRLGLKIPTLRRLMAEGDAADGVVGENPTITWPAHTTLVTGVPPRQHGILGNWRPGSTPGNDYWEASAIKTPTLWQAAKDAGLTVGAVTWPVTVTSQIDFDLPEYFEAGGGGRMALASVATKSTPGLIARIAGCYPAFDGPWVTDRTRTLAALYMTRVAHADLTLLHLFDLDAASHQQGPFTRNADAVLEHIDGLISTLLTGAPPDLTVALVSDHGFERTDRVLNLSAWLAATGQTTWVARLEAWLPGHAAGDGLIVMPGLVATRDPGIAAALAHEAAVGHSAIGRRVPPAELARWAPELGTVLTAYEPAEHVVFVDDPDNRALYEKPREPGAHHFWPGRPNFRSVFMLWGPGVSPRREPEISMLAIYGRLAAVLGLPAAAAGSRR